MPDTSRALTLMPSRKKTAKIQPGEGASSARRKASAEAQRADLQRQLVAEPVSQESKDQGACGLAYHVHRSIDTDHAVGYPPAVYGRDRNEPGAQAAEGQQ